MRHDIGIIRTPGNRLAKHFNYVRTQHHPLYPRDVWESLAAIQGGVLEEDKRHVVGKGITLHDFKQVSVDSLADIVPLLQQLEPERGQSIVIGRARADAVLSVDGDWQRVARRVIASYDDVATHLLIVDIDGLSGDLDDAPDILRDALYAIPELDGCAHVGSFTGSAGIKPGIRVRAFIETKHALTARQQRQWIKRVNAQHGDLFDASLYSPGHIVATAAPLLTALYMDGPNQRAYDMPRPVPMVRHWHMDGDVADIGITTAAQVVGLTKEQIDLMDEMARRAPEPGEDPSAWFNSLAPGNISNNVHKLICSVAFRAENGNELHALSELYGRVYRRLKLLSAGDDAKWDARLRDHLDWQRWQNTFNEARKRRSKVVLTAAPPPAAPATPVPAHLHPRQLLVSQVGAAADEIIDQKTPLHVLVTSAPGAGKSFAIREIVTEARLANRRIELYAPTHKLCEQHVDDLRKHVPSYNLTSTLSHDELAARIRHHKGRNQPGMCPNERFGALAARAEAVGMSPKKHVCSACPDRNVCPWLKQFEDTGSGVIVKAHQSITAKGRDEEAKPDLYVFDEALLNTMLGEQLEPVDIESLLPTRGTTNWLIQRQEIVAWLLAHVPKDMGVRGELKPDYRHYIPVTDHIDGQDVTRPLIEKWLAEEERQREFIRRRIIKATQWEPMLAMFQQSLAVSRLLEAMKLCEFRPRVFGARVYQFERRVDGKWTRFKKLAIHRRAMLPPHVRETGAIWLDGTAGLDEGHEAWKSIVSPDGSPFPSREINVQPEVGHVYGVQCVDSSYARSALIPTDMGEDETAARIDDLDARRHIKYGHLLDPEQLQQFLQQTAATVDAWRNQQRRKELAAEDRLRRVWITLLDKCMRYPRVLLVAQKAVVERLQTLGLPPNVETAHFNALKGLNHFKDVPCAVVVGRPAVAFPALEAMCEALHIERPDITDIAIAPRWTLAPGKLDLTGQMQAQLLVERHPDPHARSLQALISHAEVVQAVARIRPFDRGAHNPCDLVVFGQLATGVQMQRVGHAKELTPSATDVMWSLGGIFLTESLNVTAYAGLHEPEAIEQARRWLMAGVRTVGFTYAGATHYAVVQPTVTQAWAERVLGGPVYQFRDVAGAEHATIVRHVLATQVSAIAEGEPGLRDAAELAMAGDEADLRAFLAEWSGL